ncbi:Serine--glyoxylate aminotransferase [Camellia lanceoleosa]|uniref:Serine--glyoxylate aminotransferase n=1 Tax=Camellia lanceoleosa TaxID=1840588 RepID=A0ACC0G537_9ERIC|nr:Serine--glyoxylate aminotransferase [Camellia lanceoleosa]
MSFIFKWELLKTVEFHDFNYCSKKIKELKRKTVPSGVVAVTNFGCADIQIENFLKNLFSPCGNIRKVKFISSNHPYRGLAFVHFFDAGAAEKALRVGWAKYGKRELRVVPTKKYAVIVDFYIALFNSDFKLCIAVHCFSMLSTIRHAHLDDPGRTEWEGFPSGTRAAAAGGLTTLVDMPLNSFPSTVSKETFELKIKAAAKRIYVDIGFWGGLVPENAFNGSALEGLLKAGVLGLKSFMCPSGINDFPMTNADHIKVRTGAWESALTNTLSPRDRIVSFLIGQFSLLWIDQQQRLNFNVDVVESDWGQGANLEVLASKLAADSAHTIKAICIVHNETATGVTNNLAAVRKILDHYQHPALFLVDGFSSICALDFRMDEWGIDVALTGSQKALSLPTGMGIVCASPKALEASKTAKSLRVFFDWKDYLKFYKMGTFWPYTPSIQLLYGLRTALDLIFEEGLDNVITRHGRLTKATRQVILFDFFM